MSAVKQLHSCSCAFSPVNWYQLLCPSEPNTGSDVSDKPSYRTHHNVRNKLFDRGPCNWGRIFVKSVSLAWFLVREVSTWTVATFLNKISWSDLMNTVFQHKKNSVFYVSSHFVCFFLGGIPKNKADRELWTCRKIIYNDAAKYLLPTKLVPVLPNLTPQCLKAKIDCFEYVSQKLLKWKEKCNP